MKTFLHGMLVSAITLTPLLVPMSSAQAAPRQLLRMQIEEQQEQTMQRMEDTEQLLSLLQISLDENDPILTSYQFEDLVESFQAFKASIGSIGEAYVEVINELVYVMEVAQTVDHPSFEDIAISEEELAFLQEVQMNISTEFESFEDEVIKLMIQGVSQEFGSYPNDSYDDYSYDDYGLWAYGYAEPWEAKPGEIVWLKNDSDNPNGGDLTITWKQTGGPDVTWLKTSHPTDALFIAPQLLEGEEFMSLSFEMTADNGSETDYATVWVDVATQEYWDEYSWEDYEYPDYEDPFMGMAQAVDFDDPTVQRIMNDLWLDISANDPLLQDPNFETFVEAYRGFEEAGQQLLVSFADMFDAVLDVSLMASEVQHPAFQEQFGFSQQDKAELEQFRSELREEILSDTEAIGDLIFLLAFSLVEFEESNPMTPIQ